MTVFDWLNSPVGVEFAHAVIGLITAGALYLSWKSHEQSKTNGQLLSDHIQEHALTTTGGTPAPDEHKI